MELAALENFGYANICSLKTLYNKAFLLESRNVSKVTITALALAAALSQPTSYNK